ncbi:MAG: energy transducer TonB [Flavisolibacter sp.]
MTPSKNNSFSASDIERYYSGKMSAAERHALEKAALEDPFLADALEGYALTTTPSADVQQLKDQLRGKLEKKHATPFLFRRYNGLKVAAAVIVVAALTWIAVRTSRPENTSLAFTPAKKPLPADSSLVVEKTAPSDNTVHEEYANVEGNTKAKATSKKAPGPSEKEIKSTEEEKRYNTNYTASVPPVSNTISSDSVSRPSLNEQSVAGRSNNASQTTATHDAKPSSSALNRNGAMPATNSRSFKANDTIHADVVMRSLSQPPAEEVVLQKYEKKKISAEPRLPRVIIDTLEPAQGVTYFDDYITSYFQNAANITDKPLSGEVQLSFEVNDNGDPINITVLKSLCNRCDEEAIRLLKEGPKWKKKKDKKGKLTLKF